MRLFVVLAVCAAVAHAATPLADVADFAYSNAKVTAALNHLQQPNAPAVGVDADYDKVRDYLEALRGLRAGYAANNNNAKRVLVVGAGPNGLINALKMFRDSAANGAAVKQTPILMEKNGGTAAGDPPVYDRWHMLAALGPTKDMFETTLAIDLSVDNRIVISTIETVLYTSAKLLGIEVIQGMYLDTCQVGNGWGAVYLKTGHGGVAADLRRKYRNLDANQRTRVAVCNAIDFAGPGIKNAVNMAKPNAGSIYTDHFGLVLMDVLMGTDGTYSAVRQTAGVKFPWRKHVTMTLPPPVLDEDGNPVAANALPPPTSVEIPSAQNDKEIFTSHVILRSPCANANIDKAFKEDASKYMDGWVQHTNFITNRESKGLRKALNQRTTKRVDGKVGIEQSILADANVLAVSPHHDALRGSANIAHIIPHNINDGRHRWCYLDIMLTQPASVYYQTTFKKALDAHGKDYTKTHLIQVGQGNDVASLDQATKDNIRELWRYLRQLLIDLYKPDKEVFADVVGSSVANFVSKLDRIKTYTQRLRAVPNSVATLEHKAGGSNLLIVLSGDSTRDSFYVFGDSFNSAFRASEKHLQGILAGNQQDITDYQKVAVDTFVGNVGTAVYFMCNCNCRVQLDQHNSDSLGLVRCMFNELDAQGKPKTHANAQFGKGKCFRVESDRGNTVSLVPGEENANVRRCNKVMGAADSVFKAIRPYCTAPLALPR